MGELLRGVKELLAGFALLRRDGMLRSWLWRMMALLVVVMAGAALGSFALIGHLTAGWSVGGDGWYWELLNGVIWLLTLLLSLLMALVVYVALASAVAAPWLEPMAQRAARLRGDLLPDARSRGWLPLVGQALVNGLRPLGGLALFGVAALLLGWIPLLGPLLAGAVWGYGSVRYLCFELMDTHASLLGWGFGRRRSCLRRHPWYWLGFGGLAALLLMVPLLNLLVLPAAVVGLRKPMVDREVSDAV